jgi:CheY-like chemotaxis protein
MLNAVRWLLQGDRLVGACRNGEAAAAPCAMAISSLKVLVVDDHPIHRALMSGMLKMLFPSVAVDEAGDGLQAQTRLRDRHYDIVLSDWKMPDMDGLQLVAWLHSGETSPPPFVLFSGHGEREEIAPLFSSHRIDGYLIKPFDQAAIREVVSVAVRVLAPVA